MEPHDEWDGLRRALEGGPTVIEWWGVIRQFYENPKNDKPDIKALRRLLRSNASLPKGLRSVLAEMLEEDNEAGLPGPLGVNWRLRLVFVGRHDAELVREKRERQIDEAMAAEPNITNAIAVIDLMPDKAMSGRAAWTVWTKMKDRRAWFDKLLEDSSLSDELKARIRRIWRRP